MERISGPMLASQANDSKSKIRENLLTPDDGPNQAILIGLVDVGTSHNSTFNKDVHEICLIFEYPELKQLVYEDDTVPRSWIKYETMTYSLNEKSKFIKVVDAINNGKYPKDDFPKINLFDFIGSRILTSISHEEKGDKTYTNIDAYMKVGKMTEPENFISDGNRYMFYIDCEVGTGKVIGKNFNTANYAELPYFLREKLKKSFEGIEYAAKGGKFAEPEKKENSKPEDSKPEGLAIPKGFVFKDTSGENVSYESYRNGGWTDKQLYEQGILTKEVKAPVPPVQSAPTPPVKKDESFNPFAASEDDDDLPF